MPPQTRTRWVGGVVGVAEERAGGRQDSCPAGSPPTGAAARATSAPDLHLHRRRRRHLAAALHARPHPPSTTTPQARALAAEVSELFRSVVTLSSKLRDASIGPDIANPKQLSELGPGELSFWVASLFAGNPYQVGQKAGGGARQGASGAAWCAGGHATPATRPCGPTRACSPPGSPPAATSAAGH